MIKIQNIERFKAMRCKGTYATNIQNYKMGDESCYAFEFEVIELPTEIYKMFSSKGATTLTICLDRTPTPVSGLYRLWCNGFAHHTEVWVERHDLEQPHKLARRVVDVLNNLLKIC